MPRWVGACLLMLMLPRGNFQFEIYEEKVDLYNQVPQFTIQNLPHLEGKFFQGYFRNFRLGKASKASESKYPWIARVIHSLTLDEPQICTAICIEERIFLTAAKCTFALRVSYTKLRYRKQAFPVVAFVMPDVFSNQLFDDLSLIVVKDTGFHDWQIVPSLLDAPRTDTTFKWFDANGEYEKAGKVFKLIGYAEKFKGFAPKGAEYLYEQDVHINMSACSDILVNKSRIITSYRFPCCYPFSYQEFLADPSKLIAYFLPMGGPVYYPKENKVLGIATWTTKSSKENLFTLPVGFSVPNSNEFKKDWECARKIRDVKVIAGSEIPGYFQSLCDQKR